MLAFDDGAPKLAEALETFIVASRQQSADQERRHDEVVFAAGIYRMGHWSVVWDLLEGKFDYQPVGILCNTHLRFFTRHGLESLIVDAGFRVERWDNVLSPPPQTFANFLNARATHGVAPDLESLSAESFHVLARRD